MIEFLAQLLGVLLTILTTLIPHLLYEVNRIILNPILHVHLLPDLLLLPLLVPNPPFLPMLPRLLILHDIIIMIRVARTSPLGFRAVSLMDQMEAQQLAQRLGLAVEGKKSRPREENVIIRNGVIKKLEGNELNFITQETKIITDFNPPPTWDEERNNKNAELRQRDNYQPTPQPFFQQTATQPQPQGNPGPTLRKSSSFIDQFQPQEREELNLKDDYCRIWYEKIALQSHVFNLEHQNQRKDELISQLRQQLQAKSQPQPHFTINSNPHATHNKSVSMHPSFNIQNAQSAQSPNQNSSHWGSVHPGRNFNINRNF